MGKRPALFINLNKSIRNAETPEPSSEAAGSTGAGSAIKRSREKKPEVRLRTAVLIKDLILDFIFERTECPACRCESPGLCEVCRKEAAHWGEFIVEGIRGSAILHYSGVSKQLLYGFKKRLSFDSMYALFHLMDDWLEEHELNRYDYLVPVTSIKGNIRKRGFDPALLLADHLSRKTGIPLLRCVLNNSRNEQKTLDYRDRVAVSAASFRISSRHRQLLSGKRILLFDDVMTSGATICAVSKLLLDAGAEEAEFLVLERATVRN